MVVTSDPALDNRKRDAARSGRGLNEPPRAFSGSPSTEIAEISGDPSPACTVVGTAKAAAVAAADTATVAATDAAADTAAAVAAVAADADADVDVDADAGADADATVDSVLSRPTAVELAAEKASIPGVRREAARKEVCQRKQKKGRMLSNDV